MPILSDILAYNAQFVRKHEYEPFRKNMVAERRLVVLTCMDARLVEMLPHAMNLREVGAKVVKNAGAIVSHPFGSIMRSLLVAVYELGAKEVMVVGHHECGMTGLNCDRLLQKALARGVSAETLKTLENSGIDLQEWLVGFNSPEEGVRRSVSIIREHPLLPKDVPVHGLIISPHTGKLDLLCDGYVA